MLTYLIESLPSRVFQQSCLSRAQLSNQSKSIATSFVHLLAFAGKKRQCVAKGWWLQLLPYRGQWQGVYEAIKNMVTGFLKRSHMGRERASGVIPLDGKGWQGVHPSWRPAVSHRGAGAVRRRRNQGGLLWASLISFVDEMLWQMALTSHCSCHYWMAEITRSRFGRWRDPAPLKSRRIFFSFHPYDYLIICIFYLFFHILQFAWFFLHSFRF